MKSRKLQFLLGSLDITIKSTEANMDLLESIFTPERLKKINKIFSEEKWQKPKKEKVSSPERLEKIEKIREAFRREGVLIDDRKRGIVTKRTVMISILRRNGYSGPLIAEAIGHDHSSITHSEKRYEDLKSYPEYVEFEEYIIPRLKQCSLL